VEALKVVVAQHLKGKKYSIIVDGKVYTAEQLAEEVMIESEVGIKILEMIIRGTLERYGK